MGAMFSILMVSVVMLVMALVGWRFVGADTFDHFVWIPLMHRLRSRQKIQVPKGVLGSKRLFGSDSLGCTRSCQRNKNCHLFKKSGNAMFPCDVHQLFMNKQMDLKLAGVKVPGGLLTSTNGQGIVLTDYKKNADIADVQQSGKCDGICKADVNCHLFTQTNDDKCTFYQRKTIGQELEEIELPSRSGPLKFETI